MVAAGAVCIDKYEASIWDAPTGGNQITGAIPCAANGQDCDNIYARSVAGVEPRASITWFQAQAALANSGKRLPSNAEWQQAVRGTPDDTGPGTTPCNTRSNAVANTGASPDCVSDFGANDMVGNLDEWVADWLPRASCLTGDWSFSDDRQTICGAATDGEPGALLRGGDFGDGSLAGPFAVLAFSQPSNSGALIGFRGVRYNVSPAAAQDGVGSASARGTDPDALLGTSQTVSAQFSAITNCDETQSTRQFYVRWGENLFKKDAGAATESTCVTEGDTKVAEGSATGLTNGSTPATVEWSFVDGAPSPDNVNITVTPDTGNALDIAGAPAALKGSPGGVWAFETSPWPAQAAS